MTHDGTTLTHHVIQKLQDAGRRTVVLNLPGLTNPIKDDAIDISSATDTAVKEAIDAVHARYGAPGTLIHLHPRFAIQEDDPFAHYPSERDIVRTLFFLAKHVQPSLNTSGQDRHSAFVAVTRMDGLLGYGVRKNISVIAGGIPGLVKSLNHEWPSVFCRAVDIQPELPDEVIASQVIAELHDADFTIVETAFSEDGRKTTSVGTETYDTPISSTQISPDAVFLVSGGARGVTAACVIEMARVFKCKFILLGRSSSDITIPDYALGETDGSTLKRRIMESLKAQGEDAGLAAVKRMYQNIIAKKEIDDTLSHIHQYGGAAIYIEGDVTRPETFQKALAVATKNTGPVTGILHGAGRLADKFVQDKTESDFENVFSTKVDGLLALLQCADPGTLKHLILFSSVAGFYGNTGQTDYAIANEILNKTAHVLKAQYPDLHVCAINWGAWDSGMVSAELKAHFTAAGVSLVDSRGGVEMLVRELQRGSTGPAQVILGSTLPVAERAVSDPLHSYRIRRTLLPDENPFLQHHVIHGKPVLPVVNAVGWMALMCERLYPGFRISKVENTRLFKGIVFDGSQSLEYITELKEIAKTPGRIVFEITVQSPGEKLPVNHYKATVTLITRKADLETPSFRHTLSGTYTPTDGSELYHDGSLFHGHYFQGIHSILDCTHDQIVLTCEASEVPWSEQGQFPVGTLNTFFSDIQYQGMVVWVEKFMDGAKSLPLQTDEVVIYHPVSFDQELFVHVGIREASDFNMIADCTVYDKEGKVYMTTRGATLTISKQLVW